MRYTNREVRIVDLSAVLSKAYSLGVERGDHHITEELRAADRWPLCHSARRQRFSPSTVRGPVEARMGSFGIWASRLDQILARAIDPLETRFWLVFGNRGRRPVATLPQRASTALQSFNGPRTPRGAAMHPAEV